MNERRQPAGARPRLAVLSALVAVVVLGILGMHALQAHAGHAGTAGAMAGMAAGTDEMHAEVNAGDAASTVGTDPSSVSASAPVPSMSDMLMLCAFMLLGVGLALLAERFNRRVGAALHQVRGSVVVAVRETARRATGPPSVWDFSVIRC